jgi:hypothetical protein
VIRFNGHGHQSPRALGDGHFLPIRKFSDSFHGAEGTIARWRSDGEGGRTATGSALRKAVKDASIWAD